MAHIYNKQQAKGFTIVELVVIIVVIAILVAITFVSYAAVQASAIRETVKTDAQTIALQLKKYKSSNGTYPEDLSLLTDTPAVKSTVQYAYNWEDDIYCVTASIKNVAVFVETGNITAEDGDCSSFVVPDPPAAPTYTAFRFQPTNLRDNGTNAMQISQFEVLVGTAAQTGGVAYGYGHNSPMYETPAEANDQNVSTKFLNFNKTSGYVYIVFPSGVAATGYRLATANDAPERDPIDWEVYGSNDTVGSTPGTWTLLDTVTSFPTTTSRTTYLSDFTF